MFDSFINKLEIDFKFDSFINKLNLNQAYLIYWDDCMHPLFSTEMDKNRKIPNPKH